MSGTLAISLIAGLCLVSNTNGAILPGGPANVDVSVEPNAVGYGVDGLAGTVVTNIGRAANLGTSALSYPNGVIVSGLGDSGFVGATPNAGDLVTYSTNGVNSLAGIGSQAFESVYTNSPASHVASTQSRVPYTNGAVAQASQVSSPLNIGEPALFTAPEVSVGSGQTNSIFRVVEDGRAAGASAANLVASPQGTGSVISNTGYSVDPVEPTVAITGSAVQPVGSVQPGNGVVRAVGQGAGSNIAGSWLKDVHKGGSDGGYPNSAGLLGGVFHKILPGVLGGLGTIVGGPFGGVGTGLPVNAGLSRTPVGTNGRAEATYIRTNGGPLV